MTRRKEFTTAAQRRRDDPIVWVIDGHSINMNPSLEFGDLADLVELARRAPTEVEGDESSLRTIQEQVDSLRGALGGFVEPDSVAEYEAVRKDLDVNILLELISDITAEVSGRVPTSPSPSSDGSPAPGLSSTAGVVAEGSMPSGSPSTAV